MVLINDSGKAIPKNRCPMCGIPQFRMGKCTACTNKIAAKVVEEFKENFGHNLTEAILATENDHFIPANDKPLEIDHERPSNDDTVAGRDTGDK